MELSGTILAGAGYEPIEGRLIIENGVIAAIEECETDSSDIISPSFVNAHTHIGDSIAKEAGRGLSLDDLVAPPDGLKHRLLADADRGELIGAMRRSLRFMMAGGTTAFIEFREGGVDGVNALAAAAESLDIEPVLMGREEIEVLEVADGFGASGPRDNDFTDARDAARGAGKPFGIHAGERDPDDIAPALELDPDFLVHMVYAESSHLDRVESKEIPIAVCPRSNLVTGVGVPPIAELLEHTTVALGTDNVMLNSPSMFREMEFVSKLCDVAAPEVLRMATAAGAEMAGLNCGVIEPGRDAGLLVLDGDSDNLAGVHDPVRALVRRAGVADVRTVICP
jgi:cytosine/adenosine deaminase-related metal-dependent hydrolase